jgi:putative endonuclease
MKLERFMSLNSVNYYFVYITTNPGKTVLYIGITNDLRRRMSEHCDLRNDTRKFTGRYFCYNLIYYEEYNDVLDAIEREKQIKKWSRKKKEDLIRIMNPYGKTINVE